MNDLKNFIQIGLGILNLFAMIAFLSISYSFLRRVIPLPNFQASGAPIIVNLFLFSLLCMPISSIIMFWHKAWWKKLLGFCYLLGTIGFLILFDEAIV